MLNQPLDMLNLPAIASARSLTGLDHHTQWVSNESGQCSHGCFSHKYALILDNTPMDASHTVWMQMSFAPTDVNSHKNGIH